MAAPILEDAVRHSRKHARHFGWENPRVLCVRHVILMSKFPRLTLVIMAALILPASVTQTWNSSTDADSKYSATDAGGMLGLQWKL